MARLFTADEIGGKPDAMYSAGYTPSRLPERLDALATRFSPGPNTRILVAGVGLSGIVAEANDRGWPTWGIDASSYAITQAQALWPAWASRYLLASATNRSQLSGVRTAAGLTGNQRFALVITDDMLPCADTEAEAQTMLAELRRIGTNFWHNLTVSDPTDPRRGVPATQQMLWRTRQQWAQIINAPTEVMYDLELREEFV